MTDQLAARYEGTEPFPDAGAPPRTAAGAVRAAVTLAIVIVPFAGLGVAVWLAWGHGLSLADVLLAVAFYLVTGWAIGGWHGALTALLWAGLVRVTLLQHVTWSVNSLCHMIGARPFTTRRYDRATNLWPLALLSLGESWHNMHHSDPTCARHGADPWQIDISATVIRIFERLGWATGVRWPIPARLDDRRRDHGRAQPPPARAAFIKDRSPSCWQRQRSGKELSP
jgi:fatty-acid desaturase